MVRLRPFYMHLGWNLVCLGCGDGSAGGCARIEIFFFDGELYRRTDESSSARRFNGNRGLGDRLDTALLGTGSGIQILAVLNSPFRCSRAAMKTRQPK